MKVHGFVQAGGGSTRFGSDKARIELAGKTMLQRTGELLAGVCEDVAIVAAQGKYDDALWPVLADRWPGEGPLGGILTALLHLNQTRTARESDSPARSRRYEELAIILSCDMPFVTREFLAELRERAVSSNALVVVPQSEIGLEPLCACWNSRAASDVQSAFDSGVRRVTQAMKLLPMEVLDEAVWKRFDSNSRLFWNMNTPTDFDEARRLLETPDK
jgi:molybdenum cofactor guanylyltransferase